MSNIQPTKTELAHEFKEGRRTTISIHEAIFPFDYTVGDIKNKLKMSRIYKKEKNNSVAYWLGRLRGLGDIRKKNKIEFAFGEVEK